MDVDNAARTKMALAKMESVLKAAGCEKEDVVMCRIYVSSMDYCFDRAQKSAVITLFE